MKLDDPLKSCIRWLSPTINLPASGDIGSFNYHPDTQWQAPSIWRGDAQVETRVFKEVASPGSQLGTLLDALQVVVSVLEKQSPELSKDEALVRLTKLADEVKTAKAEAVNETEISLEKALDKLAQTNKAALKRLVGRYKNIR